MMKARVESIGKMVVVVVVCNILIALLCLAGAWWLVKLRRSLVKLTATLTRVERSTDHVLHSAPDKICKGQLGTYELRQAYQRSGLQLQRVQRALLLLGLGRSIWQPQSRLRLRSRLRR